MDPGPSPSYRIDNTNDAQTFPQEVVLHACQHATYVNVDMLYSIDTASQSSNREQAQP